MYEKPILDVHFTFGQIWSSGYSMYILYIHIILYILDTVNVLDSLCSLLPNFSSFLRSCRAIRSKHLSSSRLMTQLEISECMGHIWINKQIKRINKPEQHRSRMNKQQQQTGHICTTKTTKMFPITITCLHINKMKYRPAKSALVPSIYPSGCK